MASQYCSIGFNTFSERSTDHCGNPVQTYLQCVGFLQEYLSIHTEIWEKASIMDLGSTFEYKGLSVGAGEFFLA